jgi:hypothetical protein
VSVRTHFCMRGADKLGLFDHRELVLERLAPQGIGCCEDLAAASREFLVARGFTDADFAEIARLLEHSGFRP